MPFRVAYQDISNDLFLFAQRECPNMADIDMTPIQTGAFPNTCTVVPVQEYRRCMHLAKALTCEDRERWLETSWDEPRCSPDGLCAWETDGKPTADRAAGLRGVP
jgi:hypothetical protein